MMRERFLLLFFALGWRNWRLHGLHVDHAGELKESHTHVKKYRLQGALFDLGQVALRLLGQDSEQINSIASTENIDSRPLSFLCSRAHLDHGGDVELLHEGIEGDRRWSARTGILRAD